jgi:WD40 repeat protein
VTSLAFDPTGKWLAAGSGEPAKSGTIHLVNLATSEFGPDFPDPHSDSVLGLSFSPCGGFLASASADRFAKVFSYTGGKWVKAFEGHTSYVQNVDWDYYGELLATASADGSIKIWDVSSGNQLRTIAGFAQEVTAVRFGRENARLIAASGDGTVRAYRLNDGQEERRFPGSQGFVLGGDLSSDGRIVAGGAQGLLWCWNSATGELLWSYPK